MYFSIFLSSYSLDHPTAQKFISNPTPFAIHMIFRAMFAAVLETTFAVLLSFSAQAQDLKQILRKAVSSPDSSEIYFSQARKIVQSPEEQAEFAFIKTIATSNQSDLDSCLFYYKQAQGYFAEKDDLLKQIYLHHYLAIAFQKQGQYENAIETLFEAVPLAEKLGEINWRGWLFQGISLNYHDFGSYGKGVLYGKKSYELASQLVEDDPMSAAIALNTIAINYDDWGKYDSALLFHFQVLELKPQLDTLQLGFTYNNIGNTLIKQKKQAEAKKWVKTAVEIAEILQSQGSNQNYDLATYYTNLGRIDYQLGDMQSAEKALEIGKTYSLKSASQEKIRDSYEALYEYFKKSSQPDSALSYLELLSEIRDSTFNEKNARVISETEAKYQIAEKERILAEERLKSQKITFGAAVLGLFLLGSILVGTLFFRQQKLKAEQKDRELQLQKALAQVEIQNQLQDQRTKISSDLHDNIGVQLTLLTLSLERLKSSITPLTDPTKEQIKNIKSFAQGTISELRDTIWAMNGDSMTFGDLQARLFNFFERAGLSEELELILDFDTHLEALSLDAFQGITVYRIMQEGINNALKHSGADRIIAKIYPADNLMKIKVSDNGGGIDSQIINSEKFLQSLRKRVSDLNGKIDIQSTEASGTHIQIEFYFS